MKTPTPMSRKSLHSGNQGDLIEGLADGLNTNENVRLVIGEIQLLMKSKL